LNCNAKFLLFIPQGKYVLQIFFTYFSKNTGNLPMTWAATHHAILQTSVVVHEYSEQ